MDVVRAFRSELLTTLLTASPLRDESALLTISLLLSLFSLSLSLLSLRVCTPLTGCHWYGGSRVSSRLLGSGRGGMCADGNRWWFILEACWATSTLRVPFCLTIAAKAGAARPSSGDRWSLLEKGHSTVLSVRGAPLEQPRTNTVSFCWEHAGASVLQRPE